MSLSWSKADARHVTAIHSILQGCTNSLAGLQGGDLFSALHGSAHGGGAAHPLGWWRRGRSIALDVARGLHFLHSEHVVSMSSWSHRMQCMLHMGGLLESQQPMSIINSLWLAVLQVHNDLKTKNILLSAAYEVAKIGAPGQKSLSNVASLPCFLSPACACCIDLHGFVVSAACECRPR